MQSTRMRGHYRVWLLLPGAYATAGSEDAGADWLIH